MKRKTTDATQEEWASKLTYYTVEDGFFFDESAIWNRIKPLLIADIRKIADTRTYSIVIEDVVTRIENFNPNTNDSTRIN